VKPHERYANNIFEFYRSLCTNRCGRRYVFEIIEQGIVEPIGASSDDWQFSPEMLIFTKKAVRIHRDLDVDWAGITLAIALLDEIELLREQNSHLQQRLSRFTDV
jgi:chaperone modulatory protein CbpM